MTARIAAPAAPGTTALASAGVDSPPLGRWGQLFLGVLCMSMIANLQYGWTLFVDPIQQKFGWERTAIQWAFTIFVVMETWLVPIEGWFVDRYGPRLVTIFGGALCALGWVLNSYADSLTALYVAAAISGIGAGAVYGTCVGNALKWFPDRRGFAAGLTAAGFGAGSALTVIPIANMIRDSGYQHTFFVFGLGQGLIVMLAALLLVSPSAAFKDRMLAGRTALVNIVTRRQYSTAEMVRTPVFWLLYLMFVMMAAGGLMAAASLAPIAKDFKVAGVDVSLMGITLPALTFALTIDRVLNGVTRPFSACLPTSRWPSCCSRASCSSPGARSTRCSPPPAATPTAIRTRPPTRASSTPPRARPPCCCRSSSPSRPRPAPGRRCSTPPPGWPSWRASSRSSS
jgi:OFA family oxalate/formate antiporter-like MFS transporter